MNVTMCCLRATALLLAGVGWSHLRAQQATGTPLNLVQVDASATLPPPETGFLHLGGASANGHTLQVNSRYLTLDGKPWLPVMGEFHYTRVPEAQWEDEILKMKAGGVEIVATYVFWIHHEEIEGAFDWTGRRDLRRFVQLCAKHGMYVYLRPGPWAHGEVRNGGFPDWLMKMPHLRTNDPVYLSHVQSFFGQIGAQLHGLMWKDGGPVIGSQLENEYGSHGPGQGAEHILKLKQIAQAAGIDTPLWSVTGWPSLDFPPHEVIPVSGGYPDGFWFGSQTALPPSMNYLFNFNRELGDMGATVASEDPTGKVDLKHDPYFAAEEAGGMATAYHRRPVLAADDIAALTLTGIGSGINLYGYYMFHGGTNPPGKLSTLQESTATGYPNDLPELDYDFQAPLGAFGQERASFRKTRRLHLFLNTFGQELAPMGAFGPTRKPADAANTSIPRVAVRSDGRSGFLFVNNYVRQTTMPQRRQFQASIKLAGGDLRLPEHLADVPSGAYFVWPFNLRVNQARLIYSTAQVLTRFNTPGGRVVVLFAVPGIAPEFCFDAATVQQVTATGATVSRRRGTWFVDRVAAGLNTSIMVTDQGGEKATLLVLSSEEAEQAAMVSMHGQTHLLVSSSQVFADGEQVHLRSSGSPRQELAVFPALTLAGATSEPSMQGLWQTYRFSQQEQKIALKVSAVQQAEPRPAMQMGLYVDWRKTAVPRVPPESAFRKAGVWQLELKPSGKTDAQGVSRVLLQIDYTADIGHLTRDGKLLADNFFNGQTWEYGFDLSGEDSLKPLRLELLPMPANPPIYLDEHARSLLAAHPGGPALLGAKLIPIYETVVRVGK